MKQEQICPYCHTSQIQVIIQTVPHPLVSGVIGLLGGINQQVALYQCTRCQHVLRRVVLPPNSVQTK